MTARDRIARFFSFGELNLTDEAVEKEIDDEKPLSAHVGMEGRTIPPETWDTQPSSNLDALACAMLAGTVEWDGTEATLQRVIDGEFSHDELAELQNARIL